MANRKFLNPINLVNLSADPGSASEGDIYYNTTDDVVKVYANGAWVAIGAGGGSEITVSTTAPSSPTTGDAWYKNDTGELYIWDGTFWVEVNGTISQSTSTVLHQVKLGASIAKGQAVYVSSANGTNMIVSKASNDAESTSSKTMGLLQTGGVLNDQVNVITEGLLDGLDTSTAGSEGDPVWLGTNGNLIFGLANKPVAPAHLVYIGVVTRKQQNNGQIFVKVQNGYELEELHNVGIGYSTEPNNGEALVYDTNDNLWKNKFINNLIINAYNDSGATIDKFVPVAFSDNDATNGILIIPADASSALAMPAIGFTTAQTVDGSPAKVITSGLLTGVDTSTFSIDDPIFVASGGGLNATRPAGTNIVQEIGRVVKIGSTDGEILVYNTGRSTDLPNLAQNKIWLGNVTAYPTQTTLDTSVVPENGSLYFTDERAQDATASMLTDGVHSGVSVEYVDSSNIFNLTNTGVTSLSGTTNEIEVSSSTGNITIGIPDSPVFVTPDIGVATATSINGTTIPTSSTLVVSGDLSNYVTLDGTQTLSNKSISNILNFEYSTAPGNAYGSIQLIDNDFKIHHDGLTGALVLDAYNNIILSTTNGGQYLGSASSENQIATIGSAQTLSNKVFMTGIDIQNPNDASPHGYLKINPYLSGALVLFNDADIHVTSQNDMFLNSTQNIVMNSINGKCYIGSAFPFNEIPTQQWVIDQNYLTSYTETQGLGDVTTISPYTSDAIFILNTSGAVNSTSGALVVSGGAGIAENLYIGGNLDITGDFTVHGTTTTVQTSNLEVTDPLIYIATGNSANINDIGLVGHFDDGTYQHTGLVRDATDAKWKLFSNVSTEPSSTIDFTGATYDTLKIGALEVTDSSTTRTNLGLAIGTDIQAYSSNLNIAANPSQYGYDTGKTLIAAFDGTISWEMRYSLPGNPFTVGPGKLLVTGDNAPPSWLSLGTAGQVLTVNSGENGLEWTTPSGGGGGGLSTTTTSITTNSATVIESFGTSTSRTAEAIIQITQGTDYYSSKVLFIHDGTNVGITEYAILEAPTGAIPVTISAAINGSDVELRATITDAASTNATAKVVLIEVAV